MYRTLLYRVAAALPVALALAACGPSAPPASEVPTTAPTAAPTTAPTAAPAPTAVPVPTTAPTTAPAPTAAATAAPAPTTGLSRDVPWVRLNASIYAEDEVLTFEQHGLPAPSNAIQTSPDGAYIAYTSQDGQLVLINSSTFTRQISAGEIAGLPIGFAFSPDSRSLAMTLLDDQKHEWQLQVRDLSSAVTRTLHSGASLATSPNDPLPIIPRPITWAPEGIFTEYVLWASDAPPRNVTLLNPADGSERMLREDDHLKVVPSPDGARVAIIAGSPGMGQPPTMSIIVMEVAGPPERVLVAERPGFVRQLRWSPNGTTLLYAASASYEDPAVSINAINADGTGAQTLTIARAA